MSKISKDINLVKSVLFAEDSKVAFSGSDIYKVMYNHSSKQYKLLGPINSEVELDKPVERILKGQQYDLLPPKGTMVVYYKKNKAKSVVEEFDKKNYENRSPQHPAYKEVMGHAYSQGSNFAEESEKPIFVLGSRYDEVEAALKKMGWVRTNELEDIPGESKIKWQYSPKDNKDLIVTLVHEFDKGMSVRLFIYKYLWNNEKKEWYQSRTGSGYLVGYRIGRDSFNYKYGD